MTLRGFPFEPIDAAGNLATSRGEVDASASGPGEAEREPRLERLVAGFLACAVAVAFVGYYGLLCVRPEWGGDFQMYCAGVARLYRDLRHPLHEALALPSEQSTVYTPYLVAVALLGKLSGVTPYRALQVAGVFNLLVFTFGAGFLFSRASMHRRWWLSAACFIFATLCVRWLHIGWSSEMSLTNLQYIQPIPSTFAWGLAFIAFGLMVDVARTRDYRRYGLLVGVLALTLSSHVLTGSWVAGIVVLYGLWGSAFERSPKPALFALLAVVLAMLVVLPWPYASFIEQSSLQKVREGAPFGRSPLREFPNLYALGALAFVYSGLRLNRHGFWAIGLVGTLGALVVWRKMGVSYGDRYALFATFFPAFVIAEVMTLGVYALLGPLGALPEDRRWPRLDRPFGALFLAACAIAVLPSPMLERARQKEDWGALWTPRAVLNRPSPHDIYYHQFDDVKALLGPDDVVMMPVTRTVLDLASVTGASGVSVPLSLRVPDNNQRFRDSARFFRAGTKGSERRSIGRKYGVTKVLIQSRRSDLLPGLERDFGPPLASGASYTLFAI